MGSTPVILLENASFVPELKRTLLIKPDAGAIIRDGDRKRAPFLVYYWGQIAPSSASHARTLLRGFSRMSRRGNGVRNS